MKKSVLGSVAAGATGPAADLWDCNQLPPLHLERCIQIGCPAAEVYAGFAQVKRMPQFIQSVVSVDTCGDISTWIAEIEGCRYEWDVEIVQVVPMQLIGWQSSRGPKHSGRISFLELGEETLVHVEMNYERLFDARLGDGIEAAMRDLKGILEAAHPHWTALEHEAPRDQAGSTP